MEIFSRRANSLNKLQTWVYILGLFLVSCIQRTQAKKCPLMYVTGAKNHDVDGYYDFTSDKCNGRNVYLRRNYTDTNEIIYLYFHWNSLFSVGWTVGPEKCSPDQQLMYLYVWNLNQRPDRNFRVWLEQNDFDSTWRYNQDFSVTCTEGLKYGALMGIVLSCVFGVPIVVTVSVLVAANIKKKKTRTANRNNSESRSSRRHGGTSLPSDILHGNNPAFQADNIAMPQISIMSPPSYQEANTDESRRISQNFGAVVNAEGFLPPPYEAVPEEGTSDRASEASEDNKSNTEEVMENL